jgi:hypothetical protein
MRKPLLGSGRREEVGLVEFRFQPDVLSRSGHRSGRTDINLDSLRGSGELLGRFVTWADQ